MDIQLLRAEIHSGPVSGVLLPLLQVNNLSELANKLNQRGLNVGDTIDEEEVTARQMLGCLNGTEYLALTAAQRDLWGLIITEASANGAPIKNAAFRGLVLAAIPASAPLTRAALSALQTRASSRFEELYGVGMIVTVSDLASWKPVLD